MAGSDPQPPEQEAPWWQNIAAFKDAVRKATVAAEEAVAGVHRRRLVAWAASLAFIAATIVNVPSSYFISKHNAHANCVLITALAGLGRTDAQEEDIELTEFEHQSHERFGLTQEQYDADLAKKRARERRHQRVLDRIANHACG